MKTKIQEFMIKELAHQLEVEKSYNKNLEAERDLIDDFNAFTDDVTRIDNRVIN
jgi:hypothetical protein